MLYYKEPYNFVHNVPVPRQCPMSAHTQHTQEVNNPEAKRQLAQNHNDRMTTLIGKLKQQLLSQGQLLYKSHASLHYLRSKTELSFQLASKVRLYIRYRYEFPKFFFSSLYSSTIIVCKDIICTVRSLSRDHKLKYIKMTTQLVSP